MLFLWPSLLWLLLIVPMLVGAYVWLMRRRKKSTVNYASLALIKQALAGSSKVKEIRGRGLLIGVELKESGKHLVARARELGLVLNVTADKVIRLVPPLIITRDEADFIIATVSKILQE